MAKFSKFFAFFASFLQVSKVARVAGAGLVAGLGSRVSLAASGELRPASGFAGFAVSGLRCGCLALKAQRLPGSSWLGPGGLR